MGITRQQALDCFASDDLIGIGMEADAVRRSLHPEAVVTYTIERSLDCSVPSLDRIYASTSASAAMGATILHIQTGAQPPVRLDHYEAVFGGIKQRFPEMQLRGLSATQIIALASAASLTINDTIARLRDAGLDSIASSAVILDDAVRGHQAPARCSSKEWLAVHRAAHQLGMPSSATMIYGLDETMGQRGDHLELIRALQQETGGFTDFTPLPFQRDNPLEEPTAAEYLKTLAISRLYLDNIPNIGASWQTQGLKVLQMALRFGANDVGAVLLEDHNSRPGTATEEELRRIIREAGFRPAQRDATYRKVFLPA
jgi:cyclic dehypoxanthinyl futalosine synthase